MGIRLGEAIDGPIARWNPDTIDRYQNASLSDREQQKLKEQASLIRDRIGSALKSDILNNTTRIQADFGEDGLSSIKARIIDRYRKYLPRFGLTDTEHERLVHIYTKEILQRLSERGIKAKNDELESHKEKLQETSEKLASVGARFKDYVEQEISDEPFDLEQLQKKLDKKRAEIRSQRQQEHSEILAKAEFRRQLRNLRDALREAPRRRRIPRKCPRNRIDGDSRLPARARPRQPARGEYGDGNWQNHAGMSP